MEDTLAKTEKRFNHYRNNKKAIDIGDRVWQRAADTGLIGIKGRQLPNDRIVTETGHEFINLCSCSYLGLDTHPALIEAGCKALREEGSLRFSISSVRVRLKILDELEQGLSDLFKAQSVVGLSASVLTAAALPLLASGHLTDGEPVAMVFDKFCHFCMAFMKPVCADETTVYTSPHNDLNYIEDICKKHSKVAYICDGAYSMGGSTMLEGLLELQNKYGLFLFFDDSHSVSTLGEKGEGFVLSQMKEINPLTIVSASLAKGFGASGGVMLIGAKEHKSLLERWGGPLGWSQNMNAAGIGAALASVDIHNSPELGRLQQKLYDNIDLFDRHIKTYQFGDKLPIRLVLIGDEDETVRASAELFERGFHSSAVFFPIVERHKAGLRVMIRADNDPNDLVRFCNEVKAILGYDPSDNIDDTEPENPRR